MFYNAISDGVPKIYWHNDPSNIVPFRDWPQDQRMGYMKNIMVNKCIHHLAEKYREHRPAVPTSYYENNPEEKRQRFEKMCVGSYDVFKKVHLNKKYFK